MRRLTAALLAAWLLGAMLGSATAQSSSARLEPVGQRIEIPEAGIAITVPVDWDVMTYAEYPAYGHFIMSRPHGFGPDVGIEPILTTGPRGQAPEPFSSHGCTLALYRPITLTPDAFLDELFALDGPMDLVLGIEVESLDESLSRVRSGGLWSLFLGSQLHYAIGGEDAVAYLLCWAVESPEHAWLSIAETIEFLPAEE